MNKSIPAVSFTNWSAFFPGVPLVVPIAGSGSSLSIFQSTLRNLATWFFSALLFWVWPGHVSAQVPDYYIQGMHFLQTDDWERGLAIWWKGKEDLSKRNQVDPRLGIAFIETAVTRKATQYYEPASEIYLWGFSDSTAFAHPETVVEEARRLLPLVADSGQARWKKLLTNRDPRLVRSIYRFWLEHDIRPATSVNERLIEHWERIVYAREHFTKNRTSVYKTDDRGLIYVKYGKPNRQKKGHFGSSLLSDTETKPYASPMTFLDDPTPEYEVWAYDSIGTEEPGIFLFSYRYAREHYGLQPGVDYVVPQFLGKTRHQYRALYLLRYYAELQLFDDLFHDRLNRIRELFRTMESEVLKGGEGVADSYFQMLIHVSEANKAEDLLNPRYKFAHPQRSEYEEAFTPIKIKRTNFRYLDTGGKAKIAIIAALFPQITNESLQISDEKGIVVSGYSLFNKLIVRDPRLREIHQDSRVLDGIEENISVFQVSHSPRVHHFTLASEGYRNKKLFAIGRESFIPPPPLQTHPDSLELSDLLTGVLVSPEEKFPYPVFPTERFWPEYPLQVYFEIYHLHQDQEQKARYSLEIGAVPMKKGVRAQQQRQISIVYQLESKTPTRQERYGLDISKLTPGEYELFVTVKDLIAAQKKTRRQRFIVAKE